MRAADHLRELLLLPIDMPGTALEYLRGSHYPFLPDAEALSRQPTDPGLTDEGWSNPYRTAVYPIAPDNVISQLVVQANRRRAYLVIQNKGPGNMFVNFSMAADAVNGVTLVPGQSWEIIGGAEGGAFVPVDSIYALTDTAGTTGVIVEGVALPRRPALN
jgi:hypothetical protein